jgi:predicted NUDIX family NTP pyrophosphohydrolase
MQISAGLLPFRRSPEHGLQVLIAHPGGPFWARKHEGAWSVIKGLVEDDEDLIEAARREFNEETGWPVSRSSELIHLDRVQLKSGKTVVAWAFEADFDPADLQPGTFEMEWHGATRTYPEIDKVSWASPEDARTLLNPAQAAFIDHLIAEIGRAPTRDQ